LKINKVKVPVGPARDTVAKAAEARSFASS